MVLLVVALIIFAVLVIQSGGLGNFLSYDCRRAAEAMGLNWMWSFEKGCFVQQPNGSWTPIDANGYYRNQP